MKTTNLKSVWMHFTLGLSLMGALATVANAESFSIQVPFAFTAAGKDFPAGTYTVDPITSGILSIRGDTAAESGTFAASPTGSMEIPAKPSLSFDRTSDLPVLSGVKMDSGKTFTLLPAKRLTAATALPAKGTVALAHP